MAGNSLWLSAPAPILLPKTIILKLTTNQHLFYLLYFLWFLLYSHSICVSLFHSLSLFHALFSSTPTQRSACASVFQIVFGNSKVFTFYFGRTHKWLSSFIHFQNFNDKMIKIHLHTFTRSLARSLTHFTPIHVYTICNWIVLSHATPENSFHCFACLFWLRSVLINLLNCYARLHCHFYGLIKTFERLINMIFMTNKRSDLISFRFISSFFNI